MKPLVWIRANLFATWLDAAITLACVWIVWRIVPPIVDWTLLRADWIGDDRTACDSGGACWVFVRARFDQFMYGLYPAAQTWRVDAAGALLAVLTVWAAWDRAPGRRIAVGLLLGVYPFVGLWLLLGGFGGLAYVETRQWGGLMLTVFMTVYAGIFAFPLGVLLALGRQSELPVIRTLSVAFIEFWRGVPIIAVIFLASLLLPLILPVNVDRLIRAVVGLTLVVAAYMAEAIRGGLQAVPKGQYEAAAALGLGYWRATVLIVLPQALRISLPALANEFIALSKNTTLVLIVSLFDLLGIVHAASADPKWVGYNVEGYVFAGTIFWFACFAMSRWSAALETRLGTARSH
ncbi:MAG: amino acid ABC transporter permease [Azospirillum sp.]|nr:amino acid ABC transporter permease [Azospirillum sp.]MCZ8125196.1 amino acid ABC transporter permease [Magnetospirillum sp.]